MKSEALRFWLPQIPFILIYVYGLYLPFTVTAFQTSGNRNGRGARTVSTVQCSIVQYSTVQYSTVYCIANIVASLSINLSLLNLLFKLH